MFFNADNSPQGSKLATPVTEDKPSKEVEDPIAKRLAALKAAAKVASGTNAFLNSSNRLENRLNENKLTDDNEDSQSSRNSIVDIPDSIQQRLEKLKSKNKPNTSNDSSKSDQNEGRRDSQQSIASSGRGWKCSRLAFILFIYSILGNILTV